MYFSRDIRKYVCWSCYKDKFISINLENRLLNSISKEFPTAISIPTFRTQDSQTWEGALGAFNQYLLDLNIQWFVYIKFYIDKETNQSKPLVVGKTGSTLVNSNGIDVNFSEEINDGPARKFLNETN